MSEDGELEVPVEVAAPDKPLTAGDIIYLSVNRNDFDGYIAAEGKIQCMQQAFPQHRGVDYAPLFRFCRQSHIHNLV